MLIEKSSEFERALAMHTAPAMFGIKPSNLIMLEGDKATLHRYAERFNQRAGAKGLKIRELNRLGGRTLMLLYNERLLAKQLSDKAVRSMFKSFGYGRCCHTCEYLDVLSKRIRVQGDFPHEIGLFLGYPVEDVKGFILNKGHNCLLCGYWKVYSNADTARRTFERYNKCRSYMQRRLDNGDDIYTVLRICQ